ncbi:helix-turn-helix domain-containing protein [Cellulosilyticum sp. I15G10I2]|uniref:helix-turn-helix domain-containing protein n=1 Tax=Cellulosilyticum sp. I15G10I2 TaxID=1892843 RepID=UPI00085CA762|nr:helix-turn-helix transcriptional regulator [Cellulosilyticum sp. I15G10I2]
MYKRLFTDLLVTARKVRGLTQDDACRLIGISDKSTLSKWEKGLITPSESMVRRIVQVYDDPILGYVYLQQCTELGRLILPPIVHASLETLTLRFQKEYHDIQAIQMDMIDIACDGVIEDHELERWDRATKEVADLAEVSLPLVIKNFMRSKKPSQDGSLVRAYV